MLESTGLYGIPVDSELWLFSLTAMVNPLEKVNTHVTVPQWRSGAWAHPPRDSRRHWVEDHEGFRAARFRGGMNATAARDGPWYIRHVPHWAQRQHHQDEHTARSTHCPRWSPTRAIRPYMEIFDLWLATTADVPSAGRFELGSIDGDPHDSAWVLAPSPNCPALVPATPSNPLGEVGALVFFANGKPPRVFYKAGLKARISHCTSGGLRWVFWDIGLYFNIFLSNIPFSLWNFLCTL